MALTKHSLQNFILICVSVAVTFGIAEGIARIALPHANATADPAGKDPLNRILEFDPILQSRYRPRVSGLVRSQYGEFAVSYQTNELGLRDRPLVDDATTPRVLALGNSFVEGWGVEAEASFIRVAEERLTAAGFKVRLVNAGMSGYGVAQSYLLARELVEKIQPRALIFFYASTMVQADHKYLQLADMDKQGVALGLNPDHLLNPAPRTNETPRPAWRAWVSALGRYSVLIRLADSALSAKEARAAIRPGDPDSDFLAGLRAGPERLAELHAPSLRHVGALARLAQEKGLPFMLVHLPMAHQLSPATWSIGRTAYGLVDRVYPAEDVAVVQRFCRDRGLRCVSAHAALAAALQARPADVPLYYSYDFHPTSAGNRVLGEWLAGQMTQWLTASAFGRVPP